MRVFTDEGETPDAGRADLDAALDALQRTPAADGFVGIDREDGTFLQMRHLALEYRAPGWDKPRRGSLPPALRAMFHDFAAGVGDWDRGMEWIEDPTPRWWQALPWWAVVLPVLALLAAVLLVLASVG